MRRLWSCAVTVAALLALASPGLAGDPAVAAAVEADDVNQAYCADLYNKQVQRAASSTVAVAEAWSRVDRVYGETGASWLLFWRGVLAQCLGREEAAVDDLRAFVALDESSTLFPSLVKQARTRLRRLGDRSHLGQGASASYLRRTSPLEVALSWAGGVGIHELACSDSNAVGTANSNCVGNDEPGAPDYRAAAVPARLHAALDAFPLPFLGLGGGVTWIRPLGTGLPTPRSPSATLQVAAGPQVRILDTVATGRRAGWLRVEVRFAASFTRMSPMAGSDKYVGPLGGYLDAGTWALRHAGVAGRVEGAFELSPRILLALSGRFAWYASTPGGRSPQVLGAQPVSVGGHWERVELLPELTSTSQLSAGGRVGILLPAAAGVALGPALELDFTRAVMTFPNDPYDCWRYGTDASCEFGGDETQRKVFSTRRQGLFVTVGLQVRFGIGSLASRQQPSPG